MFIHKKTNKLSHLRDHVGAHVAVTVIYSAIGEVECGNSTQAAAEAGQEMLIT